MTADCVESTNLPLLGLQLGGPKKAGVFVQAVPITRLINQSPIKRVRRESRRSPVGANPTRPIGRSAGSNQSAAGGNKCGEVLWCNESLQVTQRPCRPERE